jgi:LDH2 family malate/lactate/ureidoglycolate dehydrogenase
MTKLRYKAEHLREFAFNLLCGKEMHTEIARTVADVLLEGDLLGHTTHGLQLLGPYLKELEAGTMTPMGDYAVLKDHGMSLLWDGKYLPGPWLVSQAIDTGLNRLNSYPIFTASIKQSHHIACLAAYLERVAEQGFLIVLTTSDPTLGAKVSPFGSRTPVYTPNPIAAGWPINNDLVMFDTSMSTTSVGLSQRLSRQNKRLPGKWVLDADGCPTDDPSVIFQEPPGSILPLGGLELGYKGFALGLLVETLTSGLCGFGRKDKPGRWGATVFLMMVNPAAFGGQERFIQESSWIAEACLNAEPLDHKRPVRLPGQAALEKKRRYLKTGVELEPGILPSLENWSSKLGISMPRPIPTK